MFTENSSTGSVSSLISLKYPARISRVLSQVGASKLIIQQIALVRTSIAWITGIIFLIATLIGVSFVPTYLLLLNQILHILLIFSFNI